MYEIKICNSNYCILIYYKNYMITSGGTEKFIKSQINHLNDNNISTLVFFPIHKTIKKIDLINYWGVINDSNFCGVYQTKEIIKLLKILKDNGKVNSGIIIHHLMNIDLYNLSSILLEEDTNVLLYLHDFYTACTQWNLMKNNKKYCGNALLEKEKCSDCIYFNKSKNRKYEIESFFIKFANKMEFIAPSQYMKDIWSEAYPRYKNKVFVIEHQNRIGQYIKNMEVIKNNASIKMAFIGSQSKNKGWEYWKIASELCHKYKKNYKLFYFGEVDDNREFITSVPVTIQKGKQDEMLNALRLNNIDCVILYSICPETYSYTFFESFASNAFIITNELSGNIASEVVKNQNGIVIGSNKLSDINSLLINENEFRIRLNQFKSSKIMGPSILQDNYEFMRFLNINYDLQQDLILDIFNNKNYRNYSIKKFFSQKLYLYKYLR